MNKTSWFFWQDDKQSAAYNMAADDTLLHHTQDLGVVLRFYGWQEPAISIGYFQPVSSVPKGDHVVVRRPTGGGVVDHRNDFTFSLVFPKASPLYGVDRFESYRLINGAVASALEALGNPCHLHADDIPKSVDRERMQCFQQPAKHDVVGTNGKICGGAQRRRLNGMLHQGSIELSRMPEISRTELSAALRQSFCVLLGGPYTAFLPSDGFCGEVVELAKSRYASTAWNCKR